MTENPLFDQILKSRGLSSADVLAEFLRPPYPVSSHDPFDLPDMKAATERLRLARRRREQVVIYGDYDIDGLSATAILLDTFKSFGLRVSAFIPDRFSDGYGLSRSAVGKLIDDGAQLIVTVDCGSLSVDEVAYARGRGVDIIVTDHHEPGQQLPKAAAVINPKRDDSTYPFQDLCGAGVAFKLVQAMQSCMSGLPEGQEKWLLDLVALGTVCDAVSLTGENRSLVYWGLRVLAKTRRPGLKALMAVAGVDPAHVSARSLGFMLGPRLNTAGRLENARLSLDLLTSTDNMAALGQAQRLDELNRQRRSLQDVILEQACQQAERLVHDKVLVVSDSQWSHGIIGIVASRLLERYRKPVFILQELGDHAKGSARSFGDFSAVGAIRHAERYVIRGGGHKLAAGVTLKASDIDAFRRAVNRFYAKTVLSDQAVYLEPASDAIADSLEHVNEELAMAIEGLAPFGRGNHQPTIKFSGLKVVETKTMGSEGQHQKIWLQDSANRMIAAVWFNNVDHSLAPELSVDVWLELSVNEWRGRRQVEGVLQKALVLPAKAPRAIGG
ncbi:MAG: single-stranded-DNA-specific exonuclease RecJ [Candidatus Chaera renei]|uniref:Single-stranded-DNA-specific exonuclease RecJ n=1 Tax=Candidatus Chaera renei TaxID=2506947 RepID=A0A4Q0AK00_9BACT|nr:MAG: single-stranded-DNA-specific exonuclease RecJ [Candidatus Chaera renei]